MNLTPHGPHLLDTSAVILMRRHGFVASPEAFVAFPTLGELATGVFRAAKMGREAARVRNLLAFATKLPPTDETPTFYGRITASLQKQGRPIPVNDVWNAALRVGARSAAAGRRCPLRACSGLAGYRGPVRSSPETADA